MFIPELFPNRLTVFRNKAIPMDQGSGMALVLNKEYIILYNDNEYEEQAMCRCRLTQ